VSRRLQESTLKSRVELSRVELRVEAADWLTVQSASDSVRFGSGTAVGTGSSQFESPVSSLDLRVRVGVRLGSGPELMDAPPITVHELHRHIVMGMSSMWSALLTSPLLTTHFSLYFSLSLSLSLSFALSSCCRQNVLWCRFHFSILKITMHYGSLNLTESDNPFNTQREK